MVSDLRIKISDVLGKYLKDTPMPEKKAIALVDELYDLLAAQPSVQSDLLPCGHTKSASWDAMRGVCVACEVIASRWADPSRGEEYRMIQNEVADFTIVHLKMHVDLVDFVCPSGCGLVRDNHPVNKGDNIFVKCPKCKKVVSFQLQGIGEQ